MGDVEKAERGMTAPSRAVTIDERALPSADRTSQTPPRSPGHATLGVAPSPSESPGVDTDGGEGAEHDEPKSEKHTRPRRRSANTAHSRTSRHIKNITRMPFRHRILADDEGPWIAEEAKATEWLSLFYDLVVVAVLSIFSGTHELQTPGAIVTFLSYFMIISRIWRSQVFYDVRFQAEDRFHRLAKAAQIMLFVYMGAASGGWDPESLQDYQYLDNPTDFEIVAHQQAGESWLTVLIAFCIYRAVLIAEYLLAAYDGRRAGRSITVLFLTMMAESFSLVFAIIAIVIPAHSVVETNAKVGMFYAGLGLEILATWALLWRHGHIDVEAMGERYGAFTLIILGEGFINLTRGFSDAITGLSTSNTSTYAQVFIVIFIIFMIWSFLFGYFRQSDVISARRVLVWEVIHLPLHFALLLLLAGMVNVVTVASFSQGLETVSGYYLDAMDTLVNNTRLTDEQLTTYSLYIDKLDLTPTFTEEYEALWNITQDPILAQDPVVLGYQYFTSQVVLQTATSYGIDVDDDVYEAMDTLLVLNTTLLSNTTARDELRTQVEDLTVEVVTIAVDAALTGSLWLFPTAGGVLICGALRSMLWYRFRGRAHWIVHGMQLGFGTALCLLTLLDIGPRNIDVLNGVDDSGLNPVYTLIEKNWALAIIQITYTIVFVGTRIVDKYKGDVYA